MFDVLTIYFLDRIIFSRETTNDLSSDSVIIFQKATLNNISSDVALTKGDRAQYVLERFLYYR